MTLAAEQSNTWHDWCSMGGGEGGSWRPVPVTPVSEPERGRRAAAASAVSVADSLSARRSWPRGEGGGREGVAAAEAQNREAAVTVVQVSTGGIGNVTKVGSGAARLGDEGTVTRFVNPGGVGVVTYVK